MCGTLSVSSIFNSIDCHGYDKNLRKLIPAEKFFVLANPVTFKDLWEFL